MKQVILHVGAPKTGSTYLQKHFCKNKELLRSEGIYYPIDQTVSKIAGNAKFLATLLEGKPSLRFLRSFPDLDTSNISPLSAFSTLVSEWNEESEKLVLSAENLSYSHAESMRRFFQDDIEVTVILYVRRQDQWIESYFNQLTKTGLIKVSMENFVDSLINQNNTDYYCPDWYRQYTGWREHFTNCRVIFYEDTKSNLLQSFYDAASLTMPSTPISLEKKQVSLSAHQLAYLMEIAPNVTQHEFNQCKSISGKLVFNSSNGADVSFLSDSLRRVIMDTFHNSNNELFNELEVTRDEYLQYGDTSVEHIPMSRFIQCEEYIAYKSECEKVRLNN